MIVITLSRSPLLLALIRGTAPDMSRPVRIQLSRKSGFNLQEASLAINGLPAVNVVRPSKWGNPFIMFSSMAAHLKSSARGYRPRLLHRMKYKEDNEV